MDGTAYAYWEGIPGSYLSRAYFASNDRAIVTAELALSP